MPNWCFNKIRVSGPGKQLALFLEAAEGAPGSSANPRPLSLARLLPEPTQVPEYEDAARDYWLSENWGTDRDVRDAALSDKSVEREGDWPEGWREVLLTCHSAWTPPLAALRKASEMFDRLVFQIDYDEPSWNFAGISEFRAGEGGGWYGGSRLADACSEMHTDAEQGVDHKAEDGAAKDGADEE